MREARRVVVALLLLLATVGSVPLRSEEAKPAVRNVIVMVPDGCDLTIPVVARWMKGSPLALDGIVRGLVKTASRNAVITDSAASATAYATGHKTDNGCISVVPAGVKQTGTNAPVKVYRPVATVLEAARSRKKATGLVVTCTVSHATPAAFAAHSDSRGAEADIIEQMVKGDLDVVFGGGLGLLMPSSQGGKRADGKDLLQTLAERGYRLLQRRAELDSIEALKVWGLFARNAFAPAIDAVALGVQQPTLPEMTKKAIELLAKAPNGFFLMVEGSQVDWGSHAGDVVYAVTEFLAFDEAVKVALDFAQGPGRDNTLLIVCPDHGTGGLSLGATAARELPPPGGMKKALQGKRLTVGALRAKIGKEITADRIKSALKEWWALDVADSDCEQIEDAVADGMGLTEALTQVIVPQYLYVGSTSRNHTGEDVVLWSYGPQAPVGLLDNTDIGRVVAAAMGVDLDKLTDELFPKQTE
jgi:alkaline phosphatase